MGASCTRHFHSILSTHWEASIPIPDNPIHVPGDERFVVPSPELHCHAVHCCKRGISFPKNIIDVAIFHGVHKGPLDERIPDLIADFPVLPFSLL